MGTSQERHCQDSNLGGGRSRREAGLRHWSPHPDRRPRLCRCHAVHCSHEPQEAAGRPAERAATVPRRPVAEHSSGGCRVRVGDEFCRADRSAQLRPRGRRKRQEVPGRRSGPRVQCPCQPAVHRRRRRVLATEPAVDPTDRPSRRGAADSVGQDSRLRWVQDRQRGPRTVAGSGLLRRRPVRPASPRRRTSRDAPARAVPDELPRGPAHTLPQPGRRRAHHVDRGRSRRAPPDRPERRCHSDRRSAVHGFT